MKPSFCHLFRYFSVTMEPHCALKAAKHLFKNKVIIIITLMTDLGLIDVTNIFVLDSKNWRKSYKILPSSDSSVIS